MYRLCLCLCTQNEIADQSLSSCIVFIRRMQPINPHGAFGGSVVSLQGAINRWGCEGDVRGIWGQHRSSSWGGGGWRAGGTAAQRSPPDAVR